MPEAIVKAVKIPEWINDIIIEAVTEHAEPQAAIREAWEKISRHEEFEKDIRLMAHQCVRDLVYACRGHFTNAAKRQAGAYANVNPRTRTLPDEVTNGYASLYDTFFIGRTRLGDLTGNQLEPLIEQEDGMASGHQVNAEMCRWLLAQGVTGDKVVRDVVPEKKAAKKLAELKRTCTGRTTPAHQANGRAH